MAQSGYIPWNVTAGEVPTTAYWNILGYNDASFNTGNGFNDGIFKFRHFADDTFSSGVTTYTPIVSSGNISTSAQVGYYINLGGIKLCWGNVGYSFNGSNTAGHIVVGMPTNFIVTVQSYVPAIQGVGSFAYQTASGDSVNYASGFAAQIDAYINNGGTGGGGLFTWWVIGV